MNVSRKRIRDKVVAPLVDVYAVLDEGPVLAGHLDLAESDDFQAVSYTHLTLPTTPYV